MKNIETKIKELKELAQPLQEWLIKNYDPMCTIIIRDGKVKVISDLLSIPLSIED